MAASLNGLAILLRTTGDYAGARRLFERALSIRERALGPNHPDVAETLEGMAILLAGTGDYAGARPLFERTLTIREQNLGPDHRDVVLAVGNLANFLLSMGDYAAARPLFERALAGTEKLLGPDHPRVALVLNNLARLDLASGDIATALKLDERALAIVERALVPNHTAVARALVNLGEVRVAAGDFAGARPLYDQALSIREKALGADHPDVASVLDALGSVRLAVGDTAGAREAYQRSLAIRENALGPENPEVTASLVGIANVLRKRNGLAAALPLMERAVAITEKGLGPHHPDMAEVLAQLARVRAQLGDSVTALGEALRAEDIGREHLHLTAETLPERQALAYASSRPSGLDVALSIIAGKVAAAQRRDVWSDVVRSRAIVLDEMARRHRTTTGLAHCSRDIASASERLANLLVRGRGGESLEQYRSLVETARQERESAERKLAESCNGFREDQARWRIGIDEVAHAVPSGWALVAYALYHPLSAPAGVALVDSVSSRRLPTQTGGSMHDEPASYIAFVLRDGQQDPDVVPIGSAARIDSLVPLWKEAATLEAGVPRTGAPRQRRIYRVQAARLREAAWDPVAKHLGGATKVFIVPDGALSLVSFATLPTGDSTYLVETGPLIQYLTAERDLVPGLSEPEAGRGLLAIGGPAFDLKPSSTTIAALTPPADGFRGGPPVCADFRDVRFPPLPATVGEVRDVAARWTRSSGLPDSDARILTGAAATETAFRSAVSGCRVLHLATHGFFLAGDCASSANDRGIGRLVQKSPRQPESGEVQNPLQLSGLALAGANHRDQTLAGQDDGILTAEEIASLDLSSISWAVLSACETGLGTVRAGEGVFGLRRAFQVAGAKTLIMSLWSVEDQSAREWMARLYEARLVKHLSTAEAVRAASLGVLRERRAKGESTHPFYWGAFVAAGDWR